MVRLLGRLFGAPIFEPEGLEVRPAIKAIPAAGPTNRFQASSRIPSPQRVFRHSNVFSGLGQGKEIWRIVL
jgi:hypothetical protein